MAPRTKAPTKPTNVAEIVDRCKRMRWGVVEISTGYKITNPAGQSTSIGRTEGGPNRLPNYLKALNDLGFAAAWEAHVEAKEADRKQRIADDAAKVHLPPYAASPFMAPTSLQADASREEGAIWGRIETITPERAEELLTRPPAKFADGTEVRQRGLGLDLVYSLATAIERGEWRPTHQGIALAPDGGVLDGQHRLHGIVLAGLPVDMMVTYNVEPESFYAMDSGKRRTDAQHFYTRGRSNTMHLVSALKTLWCWDAWRAAPDSAMANWGNWTRTKVTFAQQEAVLAARPQVEEYLRIGGNMVRPAKGIVAAGAVFLAVVNEALDEALGDGDERALWQDKLDTFVSQVQTGEMIASGYPAYTVRNWMLAGSRGGPNAEKRERQLLGLLKAWRYYAIGKDMRIMKFAVNEQMILPYVPVPRRRVRAAA